ncbi:MAG: hypothetical protein HY903_04170 [Deltaproteobacteria bacterium]|nr:hypothetical protein [Deltaproteobacteria bacterium]
MKWVRWRRLNNALHRDLGYLVSALTVAYALSGLAVNHTHQWNPNYQVSRYERSFSLTGIAPGEDVAANIATALGLASPNEVFRAGPDHYQLFYNGRTVDAHVQTGIARFEEPHERPLLRDFNYLHLNHPKGVWTYVADVYAVLLAMLAVTGLFVLRGRCGFSGRGKWWFAAGLAAPTLFVVVSRYA